MQVEVPDDLFEVLRARAERQQRTVEELLGDLLSDALRPRTPADVDEAMLERRRRIGEKFISGEWGVGLEGYEEGRAKDRERDAERDRYWRS